MCLIIKALTNWHFSRRQSISHTVQKLKQVIGLVTVQCIVLLQHKLKCKNCNTGNRGQKGHSVHSQCISVPLGYVEKRRQLQPAVTRMEIWYFREKNITSVTHTYVHCFWDTLLLTPFVFLPISHSSRWRSRTSLLVHGTCQSWACLHTRQWTRAGLWHASAPVFEPVRKQHEAAQVCRCQCHCCRLRKYSIYFEQKITLPFMISEENSDIHSHSVGMCMNLSHRKPL